jgi:dolichyl-phosphate-mannose--protein O-mannosyl transferase
MTAYLLGNLVGRFALSYVLVWVVMFLMLSRLNWREAFRRTNHWSGLVATTTTFLIGLIAHGAGP